VSADFGLLILPRTVRLLRKTAEVLLEAAPPRAGPRGSARAPARARARPRRPRPARHPDRDRAAGADRARRHRRLVLFGRPRPPDARLAAGLRRRRLRCRRRALHLPARAGQPRRPRGRSARVTTPARPDQARAGDPGRGRATPARGCCCAAASAWSRSRRPGTRRASPCWRSRPPGPDRSHWSGSGWTAWSGSGRALSCSGSCLGPDRTGTQRGALRLIAYAFWALAGYLTVRSVVVLLAGYHHRHSPLGIPGPRRPPS